MRNTIRRIRDFRARIRAAYATARAGNARMDALLREQAEQTAAWRVELAERTAEVDRIMADSDLLLAQMRDIIRRRPDHEGLTAMPKPHPTALMPTGTVVEDMDGTTYRKTLDSGRDPFPWTTEGGCTFGDERIAHLIADGAQVVAEPAAQ